MYILTGERSKGRNCLPQEFFQGLGQAPTTARVCCMLRPNFFVDPSFLGTHQNPTERNGIIYTGGAGFIDTAHLRYFCDNTKAAYDRIKAVNGSSGTVIITPEGAATITQTIPPNLWTKVARDISYDDALTHEISSYWIMNLPLVRAVPFPGETNSSFSPEDLCSNNLG